MLTLNTNLSSLVVQTSLKTSTNKLNQAIERMSTGFKVNHASDNAANYSIITDIDTRLGAYEIAEENASMGLDILTTASDTLSLIEDRIIRLRTLQEYAQNGTYGTDSLMAINSECNSLIDEISRVYETSEYNNIRFFTYSDEDSPDEIVCKANLETTLEQLGIGVSSFSVYDSSNTLLANCTTEKSDTIQDIFDVLSGYGFSSTITNGVIELESSNGSYINGALATALGLSVVEKEYVESTEQVSTKEITYSVTSAADGTTTFGELGLSGNVVVRDKYGNEAGRFSTDSATTLDSFLTELTNYGITGTINDGVISLTSSSGNYLEDSGVVSALGISTADSGSVVTITTEKITTVQVTTTTSTTKTNTIWETTTTSSTQTSTIWTTTTTSTTQTNTLYITNTIIASEDSEFMDSITRIDTSTMTALESVALLEPLAEGEYSISTLGGLRNLAVLQNAGLVAQGCTFVLADNIDFTSEGVTSWMPIGDYSNPFIGIFDGNGYVISGLSNISGSDYGGLFGYVGNGSGYGTIKNLGITNANVKDSATIRICGVLAGYCNGGLIENCYTSGVMGYFSNVCGGLVGGAEGCLINNCYSDVTLDCSEAFTIGGLIGHTGYSTITNCYATGNVSGDSFVGGLVGELDSCTIAFCYTSGELISGNSYVGGLAGRAEYSDISSCFTVGSVDAMSDDGIAGGLFGYLDESIMNNCYTTANAGALQYVGGLIGKANGGELYDVFAAGNVYGDYATGFLIGANIGPLIISSHVTYFSDYNPGLTVVGVGFGLTDCTDGVTTPVSGSVVAGYEDLFWDFAMSSEITYQTEETTTTTLTETLWTTTTSSETRTETIYTTQTTSTTQTSTLWVTTTSTETKTETVDTTRNILINTDSSHLTRTMSEAMTESITFAQAGISRGSLRVHKTDGTYQIITISGSDTLATLQANLRNAGFTTGYSNNKLTISGTGNLYLESAGLSSFLNLGSPTKTMGKTTANDSGKRLTYVEQITDRPAGQQLMLQVGINSDSSSQISISIGFSIANMDEFRDIGVDLDTDYLTKLDDVLSRISKKQTEYGAVQNRLESALDEISTQYENLVSSRSTLRDADVSELSSLYIQQQILQQASATLLATANQSPALALQLL